jgi:hypothetical protein
MLNLSLPSEGFLSRRFTGLIGRLGLLVVTTIVMLCLAEAALRILDRFAPTPRIFPGQRVVGTPITHFDRLIGWKKPPDQVMRHETSEFSVSYSSNSEGFRGEGAMALEPNLRRIAFIGDSFTFGIGVNEEDTFPSLIEGLLDETRSYNYGISGFGVDQMWMTLRHYADKVAPDIVVASFIWPDLGRARFAYRIRGGLWWTKPAFILRDGELETLEGSDLPTGWLWELEKRSHLFTGLGVVVNWLSRDISIGSSWHLNRALFAAIRDECEKMGSRLLIVHIPQKSWRAVPSFEREFKELGIEFLDLAQFDPAEKESLFFDLDLHINPLGHRFVASKIVDYLAR